MRCLRGKRTRRPKATVYLYLTADKGQDRLGHRTCLPDHTLKRRFMAARGEKEGDERGGKENEKDRKLYVKRKRKKRQNKCEKRSGRGGKRQKTPENSYKQ